MGDHAGATTRTWVGWSIPWAPLFRLSRFSDHPITRSSDHPTFSLGACISLATSFIGARTSLNSRYARSKIATSSSTASEGWLRTRFFVWLTIWGPKITVSTERTAKRISRPGMMASRNWERRISNPPAATTNTLEVVGAGNVAGAMTTKDTCEMSAARAHRAPAYTL